MKLKTILLFFTLFFVGGTTAFSQSVPALLLQGKTLLEQNKTDSAVLCFEKVLTLDGKNYDALAYLCNFYFLAGQRALDKVETVYLAHESPTRMQVAQYNEDLQSIYRNYYSKSENYLVQAYLLKRNDHLDDLAGQIAEFKERIGIRTPGFKKSWLTKMLLP